MIFLDTSFIVAYYNKIDVHHKDSLKIMEKIISQEETIVISDHIFDEIINVLINRLKKMHRIKEIGKDLINFIQIIYTEEKNFEKTWQIFKNQENTKFSFTDCSVLALMSERKIKKIATFDKEFEKSDGIEVLN